MNENDTFIGFNDPNKYSKQSLEQSFNDRYFTLFDVDSGAWYIIHAIAALGYYDVLLDLYETFRYRFLCPKCRCHINNFMKSKFYPPSIKLSNIGLFMWTVNFHNMVNVRLNKQFFTLAGARRLYTTITSIDISEISEFNNFYMPYEVVKNIKLEFSPPDYDVNGIFNTKRVIDSKNDKKELNNMMYTPYLLVVNKCYSSAKIILEEIIMPGKDCIADRLLSIYSPKEALKLLLELSGESKLYNVEKLYFELTDQADIDGRIRDNSIDLVDLNENVTLIRHINRLEF